MCLFIFPFGVWDKLWLLIRSVPEVSLLVLFKLAIVNGPVIFFYFFKMCHFNLAI